MITQYEVGAMGYQQGRMWETPRPTPPVVNPCAYDTVIVAFSGGKDSVACALHLLELGVDPARIELWHHEIDGREGSTLMDWPCTPAYCRTVAAALGLPILFSWRAGGFERELLRDAAPTAPVYFETPDGALGTAGGRGQPGTRRRFPQVSSDLRVRWCSAYLKIDVMAAAIRNQPRLAGRRVLVVTGERAEESAARACYAALEPHRTDRRDSAGLARHVDHWRPIHGWDEAAVWSILERWRVNPHPAYRMGWGRVSCLRCIFGGPDQWASARAVDPAGFGQVAAHEAAFGWTIRRGESVGAAADRGRPYVAITPALIAEAMDRDWPGPAILPADQVWTLPAGAFGDRTGPS